MRELDYTWNFQPDGGLGFRLQLPLGREATGFRACVDGQMGGVIKMYREWKISGDTGWLRRWFPQPDGRWNTLGARKTRTGGTRNSPAC